MNAIVSAASVASGAAVAAPTVRYSRSHPDADLIDIVHCAIEAYRPYWAANVAADRLFEEYVAALPERPAALRWSMFSHDGGLKGVSIERQYLQNGKWREWCRVDDMGLLLERQGYPVFIGTDDQAKEAHWPPHLGQESWWKLNRRDAMQERANAIAMASAEYENQKHDLRIEMGVDVAQARAQQLYDAYYAIGSLVSESRATTFDGLRAKAEYLRVVWGDEVPDGLADDVDEVLESIVRDLLGMPNVREPAVAEAVVSELLAA